MYILYLNRLPAIVEEITRQLRFVNKELIDLPAPNLEDPKAEVISLFRNFERKLSVHIQGLPDVHDADNVTPGIVYNVNTTFELFRDDVRRTAPRFHPWSAKARLTKEVVEELKSAAVDDSGVSEGTNSKAWYLDQVMDLAKR